MSVRAASCGGQSVTKMQCASITMVTMNNIQSKWSSSLDYYQLECPKLGPFTFNHSRLIRPLSFQFTKIEPALMFLHDDIFKVITTVDVRMDMLVMVMDISPILG